MQLLLKKKKKKGIIEIVDKDEVSDMLIQLETKILRAFRGHVGENNALSPRDLFVKVFGGKPEEMNMYKREYWWRVVLKMLYRFRKSKRMFVMNKGRCLFVLKSQEEANEFKDRMNRTISALERIQDKADDWVREKKWKEFEEEIR